MYYVHFVLVHPVGRVQLCLEEVGEKADQAQQQLLLLRIATQNSFITVLTYELQLLHCMQERAIWPGFPPGPATTAQYGPIAYCLRVDMSDLVKHFVTLPNAK